MRTRSQIPVEDGNSTTPDPLGLIRALDANDRFQRDTRLGAIFHPGKVSYRETSPTNSLHILIDGNHVSAHVDEVSPLKCTPDGAAHYAWGPVLVHNVVGMFADLGRRLRGRHGDQRCGLECEVVWVDDEFSDLMSGGGPTDEHSHEGSEEEAADPTHHGP